MTLNASGPISLAGATAGQSIAVELGLSPTASISLNQTDVRTLAGVLSGAIVMPTNFWGKSNHVPFSTKVTFTSNTTWTVPSGISAVRVKAWGASGGSSWSGVGGYAQADISVTAGQTLYIAVGGGGGFSVNNSGYAPGGTNGGGRGSSNIGAGGGGFSGVFTASPYSQAGAKIIAGGGGGGGGNTSTTASYSGAGGGVAGNGSYVQNLGYYGTGGTQTTAGVGVGNTGVVAAGPLLGGEYLNANSGVGGGAGWYGGGSGLKAGGGSGYVTGTNTTNLTSTATRVQTVPNSSDADYVSPAGAQKTVPSVNGNNGYLVLYW